MITLGIKFKPVNLVVQIVFPQYYLPSSVILSRSLIYILGVMPLANSATVLLLSRITEAVRLPSALKLVLSILLNNNRKIL